MPVQSDMMAKVSTGLDRFWQTARGWLEILTSEMGNNPFWRTTMLRGQRA